MIESSDSLRFGIFFSVLIMLMILETFFRYRKPQQPIFRHYVVNLSFIAMTHVLFRILGVSLALDWALQSQQAGYGLFNWLDLPLILTVPVTVIFLDLAIYAQHRAFHHWSWLWKLHRLHHADTDFDVSTGVRFHPLEIALSMAFKIILVIIFGLPVLGVLIFEVLLNVSSLFSHANFSLPKRYDHALRRIFVTPDMHRIHHSVAAQEMNSNYGFNFSVWDRLFKSYRSQSLNNPRTMRLGLPSSAQG